MPSSLIFVGLVVLWLLILVPIVARRRQEVPRPGHAARAGRVLQRRARRPRRAEEMDEMDEQAPVKTDDESADEETSVEVSERAEVDGDGDGGVEPAGDGAPRDAGETGDIAVAGDAAPGGAVAGDAAVAGDEMIDETSSAGSDAPPVPDDVAAAPSGPARRYRRGRGGYDPEAAELAASARYAFRQRIVLTLLIAALGTGIVAVIGLPIVWYLHGAIDVMLAGYLIYLRRQVRLEEEIRFRRAARVAGSRFAHVGAAPMEPPAAATDAGEEPAAGSVADPADPEAGPADLEADPAGAAGAAGTAEAALPPLPRSELPGRPRGTTVVRPDDEDPALHSLDDQFAPRHRRAAG